MAASSREIAAPAIAADESNQLDRWRGWEAEYAYESSFPGSIDGGHAGLGHRRRVVGNEDFPRRVKAATNERPPVKKRLAATARRQHGITLPRRRKLSFNMPGEFADRRYPPALFVASRAAVRKITGSGFHAFQRIFDDRSHGSHGPATGLRVLSTGGLFSLAPALNPSYASHRANAPSGPAGRRAP